ncbi:MAG: hypothetical protein A2X94_07010 [Bdellovibrionales bacterium GWB1_55_8]|nr:MAG: hypothetical protein A2X94_07010 [Bdellovibrionales bacterium GWB1_55_8]
MRKSLLSLILLTLSPAVHAWDGHAPLVQRISRMQLNAQERASFAAFADEPDKGMDQNLDASFDPLNERRWMGGTTGSTSQGFRHMYFGGWRVSQPLTTFQVPTQAIGQAPNRVLETARDARKLLGEGNRAEGLRRLAWSGHYLQDLAQPFHSVQIVHWRMVPWGAIGAWPPAKGFENLVKETTRTISNYHWAYEGYVLYHLKEGAFDSCLNDPAMITIQAPATALSSPDYPRELALAVADASVELAPELGRAEMEKYGTRLKESEIDLAHDKGNVEYTPRSAALDQVTCKALANAARATELLVEWALHP